MAIGALALAVWPTRLSAADDDSATEVIHGDGTTWTFRINSNLPGVYLLFSWTSNPGDIVRQQDGSETYKANDGDATVALKFNSSTLATGTAHMTIMGDKVGNIVGGTTMNIKCHGNLSGFIPPPFGTGAGDYTFQLDLMRRDGASTKSVVDVQRAD